MYTCDTVHTHTRVQQKSIPVNVKSFNATTTTATRIKSYKKCGHTIFRRVTIFSHRMACGHFIGFDILQARAMHYQPIDPGRMFRRMFEYIRFFTIDTFYVDRMAFVGTPCLDLISCLCGCACFILWWRNEKAIAWATAVKIRYQWLTVDVGVRHLKNSLRSWCQYHEKLEKSFRLYFLFRPTPSFILLLSRSVVLWCWGVWAPFFVFLFYCVFLCKTFGCHLWIPLYRYKNCEATGSIQLLEAFYGFRVWPSQQPVVISF